MRNVLFLLIAIFKISFLSSQTYFSVTGETNLLADGKVVVVRNAPVEFYSIRIKNDTIPIHNHYFKIEGNLTRAEQFRLQIVNNDNNYISEPFFIDTGFQKIYIDSTNKINNFLDFGVGVLMKDSKINDEYYGYLGRFKNEYEKLDVYFSERNKCDEINNYETKKKCFVNSEALKVKLRQKRDSIFMDYATTYPKSSIVFWSLYESIWNYGYNDYYQSIFTKISSNISDTIKKTLNDFLIKQKTKAVGNLFPLLDYINNNVSKEYIQRNKYTLVDFWFANCRPCISQFKLLINIYKKNYQKKFDIVAISIDKQDDLENYQKILKQNNYPWKQVLDTAGIKTNSINIKKYPSNFLLDNEGKILYVDINPYVLDDFLEKNL